MEVFLCWRSRRCWCHHEKVQRRSRVETNSGVNRYCEKRCQQKRGATQKVPGQLDRTVSVPHKTQPDQQCHKPWNLLGQNCHVFHALHHDGNHVLANKRWHHAGYGGTFAVLLSGFPCFHGSGRSPVFHDAGACFHQGKIQRVDRRFPFCSFKLHKRLTRNFPHCNHVNSSGCCHGRPQQLLGLFHQLVSVAGLRRVFDARFELMHPPLHSCDCLGGRIFWDVHVSGRVHGTQGSYSRLVDLGLLYRIPYLLLRKFYVQPVQRWRRRWKTNHEAFRHRYGFR